MKKFCVFCGKEPNPKTNEHIIPKWLISLTGNPKRDCHITYFSPDPDIADKTIPFDQLVFPACSKCNQYYSNLEDQTKQIVLRILNDDELPFSDLNIFLTWLDKIRIGLWFSQIYLGKNCLGINPHFYIDNRISRKDRLLYIYKTDFSGGRINFLGVNTPAFQFFPSCFGFVINNYLFINMSKDFLLSSRLGLPYPKEQYYSKDVNTLYHMSRGRNKIQLPLTKFNFLEFCIKLYQPILIEGMNCAYEYYNTDYIKSLCYDFDRLRNPFSVNSSGPFSFS
jgi:hypothetical protein